MEWVPQKWGAWLPQNCWGGGWVAADRVGGRGEIWNTTPTVRLWPSASLPGELPTWGKITRKKWGVNSLKAEQGPHPATGEVALTSDLGSWSRLKMKPSAFPSFLQVDGWDCRAGVEHLIDQKDQNWEHYFGGQNPWVYILKWGKYRSTIFLTIAA